MSRLTLTVILAAAAVFSAVCTATSFLINSWGYM